MVHGWLSKSPGRRAREESSSSSAELDGLFRWMIYLEKHRFSIAMFSARCEASGLEMLQLEIVGKTGKFTVATLADESQHEPATPASPRQWVVKWLDQRQWVAATCPMRRRKRSQCRIESTRTHPQGSSVMMILISFLRICPKMGYINHGNYIPNDPLVDDHVSHWNCNFENFWEVFDVQTRKYLTILLSQPYFQDEIPIDPQFLYHAYGMSWQHQAVYSCHLVA